MPSSFYHFFFFFKISICLVPFVVSVNNRSEKLHGSIIVVVLIQYNTCRDSQRQDQQQLELMDRGESFEEFEVLSYNSRLDKTGL